MSVFVQDEYEGILKTFSPNLEIVLEMVHKVQCLNNIFLQKLIKINSFFRIKCICQQFYFQIDPASTDTVDLQTVKEKMVFPFESVVRLVIFIFS